MTQIVQADVFLSGLSRNAVNTVTDHAGVKGCAIRMSEYKVIIVQFPFQCPLLNPDLPLPLQQIDQTLREGYISPTGLRLRWADGHLPMQLV